MNWLNFYSLATVSTLTYSRFETDFTSGLGSFFPHKWVADSKSYTEKNED